MPTLIQSTTVASVESAGASDDDTGFAYTIALNQPLDASADHDTAAALEDNAP